MITHFKDEEFQCHCCGKGKPHPDLVEQLEKLRTLCGGFPMHINSGYRCPAHNKDIGGVKNSQHCGDMNGEPGVTRAADVVVRSLGVAAVEFHAKDLFSGVGKYKTFTHVDVREGRKATWNG